MEARNSRRQAAMENAGIKVLDKEKGLELARQKEETRRMKKELRRMEIENSTSYNITRSIATLMDKYFLDPIIGLIPGVGDILSSTLMLPSIYVSLFKIKSIPLTLAVLLNILIDSLIGLIPFWIGNIADIFNRAYLKNMRLIVGYVEDDKLVIDEVNRKAIWSTILIAIVVGLIWLMVKMVSAIADWIGGFFA